MKLLEIDQMEKTNGGYDCALDSRLARIAGWGLGAAFGGPFAFMGALAVGMAYDIYRCN